MGGNYKEVTTKCKFNSFLGKIANKRVLLRQINWFTQQFYIKTEQ